MKTNQVKVKYTLDEGAQAPKQGMLEDFGTDLYLAEDVLLVPGVMKATLAGTGLHTEFDARTHGLLIVPRSSMSLMPVSMANHVGVIEGTYRGEIKIPLRNTLPQNISTEIIPHTKYALEWNEETKKIEEVLVEDLSPKLLEETQKSIIHDLSLYTSTNEVEGLVKEVLSDHVISGTLLLRKGTRVAQAFLAPKEHIQWEEVPELINSERGNGGFGSTN